MHEGNACFQGVRSGRLRDEFLAVEQFDSLIEAQLLIEDWRIEYNTKRPHSSPGWLAPAAYAQRWEAQQHAGLSSAVDSRRGSGDTCYIAASGYDYSGVLNHEHSENVVDRHNTGSYTLTVTAQ